MIRYCCASFPATEVTKNTVSLVNSPQSQIVVVAVLMSGSVTRRVIEQRRRGGVEEHEEQPVEVEWCSRE